MLGKLVRQLLVGGRKPTLLELRSRAHILVEDEAFSEAESLYRQIVNLDPRNAQAHFEHASILRKLGRNIDAARACDRACALDPHLPGLGTALFSYFDTLVESDLTSASAAEEDWIFFLSRANTALSNADFASAAMLLNAAEERAPGKPHVALRQGCIAALTGTLSAADEKFSQAASAGMPPAPYLRVSPDFMGSLEARLEKTSKQVTESRNGSSAAAAIIFVSCDPVYFRRFVPAMLGSLCQRAGLQFRFHVHIFNPDQWIEDEVFRLSSGPWLVEIGYSSEHRDFASPKASKTWFACARLTKVARLLEQHRLPVVMMDADVLALDSLAPLVEAVKTHDVALLRWSESKWQVWDQISASTIVFSTTQGGLRFANLAAAYVDQFVHREEGAWYLDQIALFAAHKYLSSRDVSFNWIPPSTYALFDRDGAVPPAGAMLYSITANIPANHVAMHSRLFQSFLPEIRRAYGWFMPGSDSFFPEQLRYAPDESGRKRWELGLMQYCETYFGKSRRRALDIGAHVGFWSDWLSTRFDAVDAFEPLPLMQRCFLQNVEAENVHLHKIGLGARNSTASMALNIANSGKSHMLPKDSGPIKVMRLDEFDFCDIDFVKIDTEGFESLIVEGGAETLRRNKPLMLIEEIGAYAERYGASPGKTLALMTEMGAHRVAELAADNFLYAWPEPS